MMTSHVSVMTSSVHDGGGVPLTTGEGSLQTVPLPENFYFFLNFEVKMQGFMQFYLEKNLWPESFTWGLIDPLGAEDVHVKRTWSLPQHGTAYYADDDVQLLLSLIT